MCVSERVEFFSHVLFQNTRDHHQVVFLLHIKTEETVVVSNGSMFVCAWTRIAHVKKASGTDRQSEETRE